MAWLEGRSQYFHIDSRFGKQRFKKSLKTSNQHEARELKTRVERRLRLIKQGDLELPDGMEVATFVVLGGRLTQPVSVKKNLQLGELFQRYLEGLPSGALEENSLDTVKIHLNHLLRFLGKRFDVSRLKYLAELKQLQPLHLRRTKVRGVVLEKLAVLPQLQQLRLDLGTPYRLGVDVGQLPQLIEQLIREYYLKHNVGQTFTTCRRENLREKDAAKVDEGEYTPATWICERCDYQHRCEDPPIFCPQYAGVRQQFGQLENVTATV